jgi:signal peptidase I
MFFKKKEADEPQQKRTWQQSITLDMKDLVYVLAVFMLVYMLCFRVVVVVGPSMKDTLQNGDRLLLISSVFYKDPKPGDVIVASKDSYENGECIVKRVIATEGQSVYIDFQTGVVYVDGIALEEDYTLTSTTHFEGVTFPVTVEENHVFVLGDNRDNSLDSRSPAIGQIDEREILGKAVFIIAPANAKLFSEAFFERFGVIG